MSSGAPLKNVCCRCFQPGTSLCTLCKSAYYCGRACQKKDWELGHKIRCKEIRQGKTTAAAATAANGAATTPSAASASSSVDASGDGPGPSSSPGPDSDDLALAPPSRWLFPPGEVAALMTAPAQLPVLPVGLLNPKRANSCFLNAVLQALVYTRPLMNALDALRHQPAECKLVAQQKYCLLCAVQKHRSLMLKHAREAAGLPEPTAAVAVTVEGKSDADAADGGADAALAALAITSPSSSSSSSTSAASTTSSSSPLLLPNPKGVPKPILPIELLKNLSQLSPDFELGQQEDSFETIKQMLHVLDDAWLRTVGPFPGVKQRTLETSVISQLFGGYLLSELQCANADCRKGTSRHEFFLDLSLEIIEATDQLTEMLEAFTRAERLDSKYKCGKCLKPSRARKQLTIYQPPNVLLLQLKRFRMGLFGKVNKFVAFPLELSLRKFMAGCKVRAEEEKLAASTSTSLASDLATVYRLYAVIVHLDLMNVSAFGHYVVYIRDPAVGAPKDQWLLFDDDQVTKVSVKDVLKLNAYVLLYERTVPFVSSDEVAKEEATTTPAAPTAAAASGSSADSSAEASGSTTDSTTLSTDGAPAFSTSPAPAVSAASDDPVQCATGCGFWGKPSTGSMCSSCWRKHQEDTGQIERKVVAPKPQSPTGGSAGGAMEPAMRHLMQKQMLAKIESNPMLVMRLRSDEEFRARYLEIRDEVRQFDQTQVKVAQLHADQEKAMQSAQLPPNPQTKSTAAANPKAPTQTKQPSSHAAAVAAVTGQSLEVEPDKTINHGGAKIGRNDKCPCGSGRKYKSCHGKEQ